MTSNLCHSVNIKLSVINKKKTKLTIVDRFASIQPSEYETVDEFMYLGSIINNRGNSEPEIRRRISEAKIAMTRLVNI